MPRYRLVSFDLCPFVQRSQVLLREKGIDFEVDYIDLSNKPEWFLDLSPTGKVPTLEVTTDDGEQVVLFESLVINEYLEEAAGGESMFPSEPLRRAYARGWIEYSTGLLQDCFRLTAARDEEALAPVVERLRTKLDRLERELGDGPFFLGASMSLVDAAFVPALQRLKLSDEIAVNGVRKTRQVPQPELEVDERIHTFEEVDLTLDKDLMVKEASRCLGCGTICFFSDAQREEQLKWDDMTVLEKLQETLRESP